MPRFRRPSDDDRSRALTDAASAIPHGPITGRVTAHEETIGWGIKRFERARLALRRLEPYALPDTYLEGSHPFEPGARLVVLARRMGLWTHGPIEITRVDDEERRLLVEVRTLHGHPLRGEERLVVERHPNGIVRFRIEAIARPDAWWAVLTAPLLPLFRRRFRRRAIAHMRTVTSTSRTSPAR